MKIYIKDGTAKTVGELIELLADIPKDYEVSLSGYAEYAIAVDDTNNAILIDDAKWIDEHVYQLNEEHERVKDFDQTTCDYICKVSCVGDGDCRELCNMKCPYEKEKSEE